MDSNHSAEITIPPPIIAIQVSNADDYNISAVDNNDEEVPFEYLEDGNYYFIDLEAIGFTGSEVIATISAEYLNTATITIVLE